VCPCVTKREGKKVGNFFPSVFCFYGFFRGGSDLYVLVLQFLNEDSNRVKIVSHSGDKGREVREETEEGERARKEKGCG